MMMMRFTNSCCNLLPVILLSSSVLLLLLLLLFPPRSAAAANSGHRVHIIELGKPIKSSHHNGVTISPTIYRLEDAIRDDGRILVNTVDIRDTRHVTSALLPRGFVDTPEGIDALQGRRAHAFVAPMPKNDGERRRYQWTHEDFQNITPHSVVILMDTTPGGQDEDHEHDLLTPEAVDCLIYDKQIAALITNHRYIDGRRDRFRQQQQSDINSCQSCNATSLELVFLNNGVVIVVSAAPLSDEDAAAMAASGPLPKQSSTPETTLNDGGAVKYRNHRGRADPFLSRRRQRHHHRRYRRQQDPQSINEVDFDSFFYAYFHVFQPDRSVPVGLAAVTLLNYTTRRPTSLSHEWYQKDAASSPLPVWPGTPKTVVRVTMGKGNRAVLFSEQQGADDGEQHPAFFTAPPTFSLQHHRPPRPHVHLKFAEHFGTHVDVPFHMLPSGMTIATMPKSNFFSPCCYKVDLSKKILSGRKSWASGRGITIGDYKEYNPVVGGDDFNNCVALFHTGFNRYWRNSSLYINRMVFPGISPELATMLLQPQQSANSAKLAGIGIDTLSIDPGSSEDLTAHVIAAANGAFVLENLNNNVNKLPDGGKPVPCLVIPLRIEDGSGSPAKVVAFLGGQGDYDYSEYDSSYPFINMVPRLPVSVFSSPISSFVLLNLVYFLITTFLTISL